jgi:hypothetical protein
MFRSFRPLVLLVLTVLATSIGCVRTIQPILRDDQVTTDNAVIGKWISDDGKTKLDIQSSGPDDKSYKLLYTDDKDKTGNFIVRLGKIDTVLLAEIHPAEPLPDASGVYKAHLLSLYSFVVVDQTTPKLVVSSLSMDWLKKYLQNNPTDLETAPVGNDDFIVSATTADFQAFFLKHWKDEGAMGGKETFVRQRRAGPRE